MRQRYATGPGLPALFRREWKGKAGAPVAYVGHSQPTHSAYLVPLCESLSRLGWTVAAGDLRGHGGSVSERSPRAHLDPNHGWEDWIGDFSCHLSETFRDTPPEHRFILAPNISALLTLECLKQEPDIARNIVLFSPPPNQPTLSRLGLAYVRARSLFHPYDQPDEQTLHNFYSFLGAHLKERRHLADVISRDTKLVERIVSDETAWVTPTLGYWSQVYRGAGSAWDRPTDFVLPPGVRVLVLHGDEDAMLRDGRFAGGITDWFLSAGAETCAVEKVDGGRQAFYLDGCLVDTVQRLVDFAEHRLPAIRNLSDELASDLTLKDMTNEVFERFGLSSPDRHYSADELVEVCYDAIHDDSRWVEVLYRFLAVAGESGAEDDASLDAFVARLMPHLQRAFDLNRQIVENATLGVILQELIERLRIGTAIVTDDHRILSFNPAFSEGVRHALGMNNLPDLDQMSTFLKSCAGKGTPVASPEQVLMHAGDPIGILLRPRALHQTALRRGGPSSLAVLRIANEDSGDMHLRAELLELAFGLTRNEALVALSIASGDSPETVAHDLNLSINTVRTHLKRCYTKMDVRGQNDLTARLLRGPIGWLGGTDTPPRK